MGRLTYVGTTNRHIRSHHQLHTHTHTHKPKSFWAITLVFMRERQQNYQSRWVWIMCLLVNVKMTLQWPHRKNGKIQKIMGVVENEIHWWSRKNSEIGIERDNWINELLAWDWGFCVLLWSPMIGHEIVYFSSIDLWWWWSLLLLRWWQKQ